MTLALGELPEERRRRLTHRALPLVAGVAGAALCAGIVYGALRDTTDQRGAKAFAAAWERGDYPSMYRLLTPAAQLGGVVQPGHRPGREPVGGGAVAELAEAVAAPGPRRPRAGRPGRDRDEQEQRRHQGGQEEGPGSHAPILGHPPPPAHQQMQ